MSESKSLCTQPMVLPDIVRFNTRITNFSKVSGIITSDIKYDKIVYLPTGEQETGEIKAILDKYFETETTTLKYFLDIDTDHQKEIMKVFLVPVPESA